MGQNIGQREARAVIVARPRREEAMATMCGVLAAALVALTIGGCAGAPSQVVEDLAATGPGQFRYTATATMLHPLSSPQGEQHRLRRLDALLQARGLCPNGYEILSRTPAPGHRLGGSEYDVRDITYMGRCQ